MSSLQGVIQGAHAMAAFFGGPHWLMNDADAKTYAAAWQNALKHFSVAASQKAIDCLALGMQIAWHEGMRMHAQVMLRQNGKARPTAPQAPAGTASFTFTQPHEPNDFGDMPQSEFSH